MKTKTLATASLIALMGLTTPALTDAYQTQSRSGGTTMQSDRSLDSARSQDIKAWPLGSSTANRSQIVIDANRTASTIIGMKSTNSNNDTVAEVTDIILDQNGNAKMIVASNGRLISFQQHVAFEYGSAVQTDRNGRTMITITESMMENAAPFSYERDDTEARTRVIPRNSYSVNKLMNVRLLNERNSSVASVEDIAFRDGKAAQLVVRYGDILGFGGERVALAYNDAKIIQNGDALDFQLPADKARQLESHKNRTENY